MQFAHELDTVAWKKERGGERKSRTWTKMGEEKPHVSVSQAQIYVFL